jgi:hypothetical protein
MKKKEMNKKMNPIKKYLLMVYFYMFPDRLPMTQETIDLLKEYQEDYQKRLIAKAREFAVADERYYNVSFNDIQKAIKNNRSRRNKK